MKVVYEIPDFLEDKFTNMEEKDICDYITKALAKDSSITDRLCLDLRIDQTMYFQQVLNSLQDIKSSLATGAVISAGSLVSSQSASSSGSEVKTAIKEEKYVAFDVDDSDSDIDEFGFGDFIS